jgi:N-acetylglucosamine-6-phosphate deacetylase
MLRITHAEILTPFKTIHDGTILIKNDKIEFLGKSSQNFDKREELDVEGMFVAPGLIDIQINGFMGVDFSDEHLSLDDLRKATFALWEKGVTTFFPTLITNAQNNLKRSFSILARVREDKDIRDSISGFHLEGPYISPAPGFRGAHLQKYIREPDWHEFSVLQKEADNMIRLITLAPEQKNAISFIKKCKQAGVTVALGHHNGSSEIIHQAVEAGATISTHLGNGCANLIDRHKNPLWPQLANDQLSASIIADGHHLNSEEVNCFFRMKGVEKTILVSDALDLAGLPKGEYVRLERTVVLSDVVTYPAENVLAGAASPLSSCVTTMMKMTGCPLEDSLRMASTNPARALELENVGEIKKGKRADLILFTIEKEKIVVQKTIVAGKVVFSR